MSESADVAIVWFRRDLRLSDQPALAEAARRREAVVPVYIMDDRPAAAWQPGGAAQWWLHHSLASLDASLRGKQSRLVYGKGDPQEELLRLVDACNAKAVYWNRCYEPSAIDRDRKIKSALEERGVEVESFNGSLLFEPWEIETKQGEPYKVFTPFWRTCMALAEPDEPARAPRDLKPAKEWPNTLELDDLGLQPTIDWAGGLREFWEPGEEGARKLLDRFLGSAVQSYKEQRDRPDTDGTSRLSPYLHHGEISPRTVWHRVSRDQAKTSGSSPGHAAYLRELGWREFGYHLLYHFPRTTDMPLRQQFAAFPWASDDDALRAWQKGRTGYPIVDAGMRQLWHVGWMHNRVRMIVASFLVKHLRLHWLEGARWFWDTLVDADLANNTLGWQWAAGCGADAAPYFRIFNPILQGEKFDPEGAYVKQWTPELSNVPAKFIHKPWQAPAGVLREASVELGKTYPEPIVDHSAARDKALEAFEQVKGK